MRFSKSLFGAVHSVYTSFSADIKVNKFDTVHKAGINNFHHKKLF